MCEERVKPAGHHQKLLNIFNLKVNPSRQSLCHRGEDELRPLSLDTSKILSKLTLLNTLQ
jgi:hypothetical protein